LSKLTIASQFWVQSIGVLAVVAWTAIVTWIIVKIIKATTGLRVDEEEEAEGLDIRAHGERGYML
ncbi:MAG: ammonium transporter, partial [Rhodospirillales bacterium]|nr:ammonium transporter [Rhodospirillales bacterium]